MRAVAAYDISARMQYGSLSLQQAAHDAIHCGTTGSAVALGRTGGILQLSFCFGFACNWQRSILFFLYFFI